MSSSISDYATHSSHSCDNGLKSMRLVVASDLNAHYESNVYWQPLTSVEMNGFKLNESRTGY